MLFPCLMPLIKPEGHGCLEIIHSPPLFRADPRRGNVCVLSLLMLENRSILPVQKIYRLQIQTKVISFLFYTSYVCSFSCPETFPKIGQGAKWICSAFDLERTISCSGLGLFVVVVVVTCLKLKPLKAVPKRESKPAPFQLYKEILLRGLFLTQLFAESRHICTMLLVEWAQIPLQAQDPHEHFWGALSNSCG